MAQNNQPLSPPGARDRREFVNDQEELLRTAFEGMQAAVWTAFPAIIQSFNAAANTCVAQLAFKLPILQPDGSVIYAQPKPCLDCPVQFASGGGFTLTVPLDAGDEGVIIFASRCIDNWWAASGVQIPPSLRMHDLSDGIFIPGIRSIPRALSNISTTTAQLRSDDGTTYVEVAGGGVVNIVAPGGVNMTTPVLTVSGVINAENAQSASDAFTVTGTIKATGDVQANNGSISLVNHVHTGVQTGGGNTGPATG